jgi:protein-S-isoprenylcysteine O-methyltransferase Ste14
VPVPWAHVVGLAAGYGLRRLRSWPLPGRRSVHHVVGWTVVGAGGHLIVRSVLAAARLDLARPERLVTAYPYSVSRNPMYLGWALLHLGVGLATGCGWIIATLPATAAWVNLDIRREERRLAGAFGLEYERYRAAVPRYLALSSPPGAGSQQRRRPRQRAAAAQREGGQMR